MENKFLEQKITSITSYLAANAFFATLTIIHFPASAAIWIKNKIGQ